MSSGLRGKSALVTGGTSGIGRAVVLALARAGAHVVLTGRREAEGSAVAREVSALGVKGVFVRGDVTDEGHVEAAVRAAAGLTGRLDLAVNNAGAELGGVASSEATPEQYRRVFDVNVLGVMLSMKHQIRAMGAGGAGSIVNVASIAGTIGMAGVGIYVASKHAVLGLTKCAALEVAQRGIRVNAVSPAAVDTDMYSRFTNNRDPGAMEWMRSLHPIGRVATPEDIVGPVLFLLGDEARYVTGANLMVDGGFTAT